MGARKYENLYHRLVANIAEPANEQACWEHQGTLSRAEGYPRLSVREGGKHTMRYAHHLMFETFHGERKEGHEVDHICHNHRCINPDHLQLLPIPENRAKNQYARRSV